MKNFKKSEILEMFSQNQIEVNDYGFANEIKMFWVEVPNISWQELRKLGDNIFDIFPRNDHYIIVLIENVIDE